MSSDATPLEQVLVGPVFALVGVVVALDYRLVLTRWWMTSVTQEPRRLPFGLHLPVVPPRFAIGAFRVAGAVVAVVGVFAFIGGVRGF